MENELDLIPMNTLPQDITITDLKNYLRIDFDDPDNDKLITMILTSAKSFVQTYLGWRFDSFPIAEPFPEEITIALLSISEHWYKNRGVLSEDTSKQELPYVFAGILDMHRNWQVDSGVIT